MPSSPFPRRAAALLLGLLALPATALSLAPSAAASDRLLVADGRSVRAATVPGSGLADAERTPSGGLVASAARVQQETKDSEQEEKKSKKKAKKAYDLTVVRKAINKAGGAPNRKYDARAALTSAERVLKASPKKSQAHRELEAVLKTTTQMARGNRITGDRMLMLTETLERNAEWWKLRKATGSGQRVQFTGSELVWQYYAGAGLQLQWLGTFGQGNMLWGYGSSRAANLAALVDEALRLAVPRAGGISWEYFFPFGGGSPPWVSGMAEATGIQVLARASARLARPELLAQAKSAMGILRTGPPSGVSVGDATGTHFLIYSFDTGLKVLNAHNQTVNGLYAYVLAAPDDVDARLLLLDGLRWLDANVDRYVKGDWTLYSLGGAGATTHYHTVARDFLRTLCALLKTDAATPSGGPTGAFPQTRICAASDTFTRLLAAR